MMDEHEQRKCELQSTLFEESLKTFSCSSSFFIAKFMNSEIAKRMDDINNPYNYYSLQLIIDFMKDRYPSLNKKIGHKYPPNVIKWIGYIYRAWSIIAKKTSYKIYKIMKSDNLLLLYDSYHTFSPEYCVEQLEELVSEGKKKSKSDYLLFKTIYSK